MDESGEGQKKKVHAANVVAVLAAAVAGLIGLYVLLGPSLLGGSVTGQAVGTMEAPVVESDHSPIILKLESNSGLMEHTGAAKVFLFDQRKLFDLQGRYPDVYKEAREGLYNVQYSDLLVFYDYENDKIVKQLRTK